MPSKFKKILMSTKGKVTLPNGNHRTLPHGEKEQTSSKKMAEQRLV